MENSSGQKTMKRKRSGTIIDNLKSSSSALLVKTSNILLNSLSNKVNIKDHQNLTPDRILKILIRGLGSSNDQVQRNYFAVLVMMMKNSEMTSTFTIDNVFETMQSELHLKEVSTKGEEGEVLLGRVLTFGAVVRSGLLIAASREKQKEIFSLLLHDIQRKSYLPLVADPFIAEYLKQVDESVLRSAVWPVVREQVAPGPAQTTLTYHMLLICEARLPQLVAKATSSKMAAPAVLSPTVMPALVSALKNDFRMRFGSHPLYVDIFQYLANTSSYEVIGSFWSEVEKQLFKECGTNHNKPMMAVKFFSLLISQLKDASQAKPLITPTLLSWVISKHAVPKNVQFAYGQVCKEALDNLSKLCLRTESSKSVLSIIKTLLFSPGNKLMEEPTGLRVVQQVTSQLKAASVVKLADMLRAVLDGTSSTEDANGPRTWHNKEKLNAIHLFCKLLALPAVQASVDWRQQQLQFLFDAGFFTTAHIGVELAGHIRDSFFSNLNHRLPNLTDFRKLLASLVEHINGRIENGDQLRIKLPAEVIPEWKKMHKTAKKIGEDKKYKKEQWVATVFQTMYYHIGLHLFKEAKFAIDVLQELHCVLDRMGRSGATEAGDPSQSQSQPHWSQVVVEMFLSLLSRNSQTHRHLANCVFSHFCPVMQPENIHQILQVLDPKSSSNPLLDSLDPGPESGSDADDSSSEDEGKEDEESSDDGMSEEEEEEIDEKQNDKLRRAVFEALGDNGALTDVESVDLDDMDEEEAARVDRALSAAFRAHRRGGKRQAEAAQTKALVNFRLRVLDLVEGWIGSEPPLDLLVDTLITLLNLLEHALVDRHQAPLEARLRAIIKKTTRLTGKKFKTTDCKSLKLGPILKSLLDKGERTSTVLMSVSAELAAISHFLVKSAQHPQLEPDPEVASVLESVLHSYFTMRDCLLPLPLFQGLFRINAACVVGFAAKLPDYAFDASVHPYRRTKALEFLIDFWRNFRNLTSEDHSKQLKKVAKKLYKASVAMVEKSNGDSHVKPRFLDVLRKLFAVIHKKWLPDIDLQQHLRLLLEFQRAEKKQKKASTIKEGAMEIDNENEIKVQTDENESKEDVENEEGGSESEPEEMSENEKENPGEEGEDNETDDEDEEKEDGDETETSEEDEEAESSEGQSETEEIPSKKSKKKANKKINKERVKRLQLLKKSSKTRRLESMSAGLEDNVFSTSNFSLLSKKAKMPSPDR